MTSRISILLIVMAVAIPVFALPAGAADAACTLSIASIPGGSRVTIDGQVYGSAPLADIPLACGFHSIGSESGGYLPYTAGITLGEGEHRDILANLQREPDRGQALIRSEPAGGDLYVDGKARGTTPVTVDNLLPGRHEILIQKEGYEDYRDVISISAETAAEYREYLVPLPGTGFLAIASSPEGAEVRIDGKPAGVTPTNLQRFPAGNHTVEIARKGYGNFTGIVNLRGGESLLAKTDLVPLPTTSTLYLDSSPEGAGVFLNNTFKGSASLTLDAVPSGTYDIAFRFMNGTFANQSFGFQPGATYEILAIRGNGSNGSITSREWLYPNLSRAASPPGWISINATPVIERNFSWSAKGGRASITIDIPADLYQYYRSQPHPTALDHQTVDGYAISERDRVYLHELVNRLKDAGGLKSYGARNDYRNAVAFVQSLEYENDAGTGASAPGDYWKYPIETLADGGGDCEDTAILAAALLKEMGYDVAVVFLPGSNAHAAVAIACDTCNGYYYPIDGKHYYYLETAGDEWFSPGTMEKEYQSVKAAVIPL